MSLRRLIHSILPTTFPKAIVYFVLVLSVVMVQFRYSPPRPVVAVRKPQIAPAKKVLVPPVQPALTEASVSPKKRKSLATKRFTKTLELRLTRSMEKAKRMARAPKPATKAVAAATAVKAPLYEVKWESENDVSEILESDTPIDELILTGLSEEDLIEQVVHKQMLAFHLEETHDTMFDEVPRLAVTEGSLLKDDFQDLKTSFGKLAEYSATEMVAPPPQPRIELELPDATAPALSKDATEIVADRDLPPTAAGASYSDVPPVTVEPEPRGVIDEPEIAAPPHVPSEAGKDEDSEEFEDVVASHGVETEIPAPKSQTARPQLGPMIAGIGSLSSHSQDTLSPRIVTTQDKVAATPQKQSTGKLTSPQPELVIPPKPEDSTTTSRKREALPPGPGGDLVGKVSWDSFVDKWLENNKGHVELRLEPKAVKNQGEVIFLHDYEFPDPEFTLNTRGMAGKYRLVASFFTPAEIGKVAQVIYPKEIELSHPKEKIRFTVKRSDLEAALSHKEEWVASRIDYRFTVFEGASGNHREPKVISGAQIYFSGFPEFGIQVSDREGNVRFSNLAPKSEYVVYVEAPGYFPARYIVPAFTSHGYFPLYLVEKDKVESITRYFTKHEQVSQNGLVFGRTFDPITRVPKAGEELQLSARKGRALYIDALPNRNLSATTETGLFAFFNVTPGVRSLLRGSNPTPLLFTASPGVATYFEIGRSGKGTLKGRVNDPFRNAAVEAEVRMVGNPDFISETLEDGLFKIDNVDLPQGVVTLEITAKDYPKTWTTIPWSAKEPQKRRDLYLVDQEVIDVARKSIAKVSSIRNTGTIVGGADPSLFQSEQCLMVALETIDGKAVNKELGPYGLSAGSKSESNCVTAKKPGFAFFNVPPGEYLLKWVGKSGKRFRNHVIRVGQDRTSIVVN